MGRDQLLVDPAGEEGFERGHRPAGTKAWSLRSERFGMHRGEAEPEHMAEREHMIRDAAAVGVMDGDVDVAAVIQKPVDDVRGLAFGRGDDLRVEGGVAARDEGENETRKRTFVRTDRSGDLAPSPERETLAVGARYVGGVEGGRQGLGMLRGHHPRQGRARKWWKIESGVISGDLKPSQPAAAAAREITP